MRSVTRYGDQDREGGIQGREIKGMTKEYKCEGEKAKRAEWNTWRERWRMESQKERLRDDVRRREGKAESRWKRKRQKREKNLKKKWETWGNTAREMESEAQKGREVKSASVMEINGECDKLWSRDRERDREWMRGAVGESTAWLVSRVLGGDRGETVDLVLIMLQQLMYFCSFLFFWYLYLTVSHLTFC